MLDKELISFLRKSKTMVLSVCDEGSPWALKVYYAMDRGFLFLIEKNSRALSAIQKNPRVSFAIDRNRPDFFVQGEGRVEILGDPVSLEKERGILIAKVPQDILFINLGTAYLARLVPEKIKVTDMRDEPKVYYPSFSLEELTEKKPLAYVRALRPWSFQMSVSAMVLGVLLARRISPLLFLLGIIGIILVHGAFNALSDYFDYVKSVDLPQGMGSAGSRVLLDGLMKPKAQLYYVAFLLALSISIAAYLSLLRPLIIPYVILGVIAGSVYGIPKVGLKWVALGDLGVLLAFGPGIILGTMVLMGARPDLSAFLISLGIGMVIVAVLHANNWRDIEDDRRAGVRTLASILGEEGSRIYYLSLIWLSYALFAVAVLLNKTYWPILGSYLTMPWAYRLSKIAMNPRSINRKILDQQTGFFTALHMYFSIAFLLVALIASLII